MNDIDSPKLGGGRRPRSFQVLGANCPHCLPPPPPAPASLGTAVAGACALNSQSQSHSHIHERTLNAPPHIIAVPSEIPGPPDRPTQARYSHVTDAASHQPITAEHGRAEPSRSVPSRAELGRVGQRLGPLPTQHCWCLTVHWGCSSSPKEI